MKNRTLARLILGLALIGVCLLGATPVGAADYRFTVDRTSPA